jgi:hypothetical protein
VIRAPGAEQVSSWAAPGSGSGGGAPAGPDARRRGRDWHGASSSTGSFAVAASAMMGISDTGVKRSSQCSDAGRGCQQRREGPISSLHCTANTLSVGLVGREDLLSRVGDEHLQERPVHAVTACTPLRGVPPVLPETRTPRGDVPLHGGLKAQMLRFTAFAHRRALHCHRLSRDPKTTKAEAQRDCLELLRHASAFGSFAKPTTAPYRTWRLIRCQ